MRRKYASVRRARETLGMFPRFPGSAGGTVSDSDRSLFDLAQPRTAQRARSSDLVRFEIDPLVAARLFRSRNLPDTLISPGLPVKRRRCFRLAKSFC